MVSKEFIRIYKTMNGIKKVGYTPTIEEQRDNLERLTSMIRLEKDVRINQINVDGRPAEWISRQNSTKNIVVLYLHGGGYVAGGLNTHRGLSSHMARLTRGRTLLLDYRLAPEYPFPEGLEDSVNTYKWLIESEKTSPEDIIIAGDSAGGGLTIATLIKLRDEKIDLPKVGICLSPWLDLTLTSDSFKNNADIDSFLTPELLVSASKAYYGENDPKDPLISPIYANLQGLPPIFITVGTQELLYDDTIKFAQLAKESGVELTLKVYQDMIHVFQGFSSLFPEAENALKDIGDYIQKHFK